MQEGVGLGEMAAAEETAVGGERRGMGRGEDMVLATVDVLRHGNGVAAPEEEDDARCDGCSSRVLLPDAADVPVACCYVRFVI